VIHWYRETITEAGRGGVFWMLIAFIVTFAVTRGITRHIRSGGSTAEEAEGAEPGGRGGLIKDIHVGGVHVHHQVLGIILVLVSALLQFAYQPGSPGLEILGALFGAGAALTLDEFALWLHLDDVYWSKEGQKSIDAVVLGACLVAVLCIGTTPLGVDDPSASDQTLGTLAVTIGVNGAFAVFAFLKGKLITGAIGLLVPFVAVVGAIRLAKPGSPWARWRYGARPEKRARAERRSARYDARWDRVRAALGGAPSRT
jgi:hypothetical protein